MGWTEVRVLAPQGWEELVAETLQVGPVTAAAFGRSSLAGEAPPEGHELVRCYLAADDDTPALRATLVRALAELGARAGVEELGGLAPEFRELPPEDYARSWRKGFRAFRLGRLCLVPPWIDYALAQNPNTHIMLALPWGTDPASTSAAACSFQGCSASPSASAEALMPNTGTSSAMGVTCAALWRDSSQFHTP